MELIQIIVLAVVQGLSEFLPISSSGHLILVPHFLGWPDQGLAFDVAVHVGTLVAVVLYFRHQLGSMARDFFASLGSRQLTRDSRLAWYVLIGTIPVGLVGLLFGGAIETHLRSPLFVAGTLSFFGILLWLADRSGRQQRDEYSLRLLDVVLIGMAQALALMPGTSRSGITMTAGLALGLTRSAAARFSFLLAVPGIAMAGAYECLKLVVSDEPVEWTSMAIGAALAAASGYACIHFLIRFIERIGMLPFTIYRLLLAGVIVAVFA
ncbi:MAG TPA: undecaprenyl-diphosphate phosphatase [Steroidobacteraceae bacterium]|nr:undecaprenyl-diphosphate phosphatase [Steroidobacteraceae bacterium]